MTTYRTFAEALEVARRWNRKNNARIGWGTHQSFLTARVEPMGAHYCASIFDCHGAVVERLGA